MGAFLIEEYHISGDSPKLISSLNAFKKKKYYRPIFDLLTIQAEQKKLNEQLTLSDINLKKKPFKV